MIKEKKQIMNKQSKKNMKKIMILVCMCMIFILIYETIRIYAVFHSEVTGNVQFENGTWNIIINGTEISKGVKTSFVIDQITTQENEHVKTGNLAPGLSGSFEIAINPKSTNVSVKYDILLNQENLNNSSLKIKSIQETEEGNTLIRTAENTYTAVIPLEKIKAGIINKITVEVEWADDEQNSKEDTKLGTVYESKLQIPITVNVCQYLGETITPYVEN